MLTHHEVASYLLRHQYIDPASVIAGDLIVEDVSRRNRNFKVISQQGRCYLLKAGIARENAITLAHEAAIYELLESDARINGFGRYLPRCCLYDPLDHVLVLELLRDAEDLRAFHIRRGRFSTALAAVLGDALGALHSLTGADTQKFGQPLPWALSAHYPNLDLLQNLSSVNLQLIEIIQRSAELCSLLDELRSDWSAKTLIHYDLKWDNCVVAKQPVSKQKPVLKVVDWEFAGIGDPCWDVGSVLSNYLSFWLLSIPIAGDGTPDRFMELARYPLERMRPAIQSFWHSYMRRMDFEATSGDRWLLSAIRFAAARLVQTAFEHTQTAIHLTGNVVCLLQLSLNILRQPQKAAIQLLGIQ